MPSDFLFSTGWNVEKDPNGTTRVRGHLAFAKGDDGRLTPMGLAAILAGISSVPVLVGGGVALWANVVGGVILSALGMLGFGTAALLAIREQTHRHAHDRAMSAASKPATVLATLDTKTETGTMNATFDTPAGAVNGSVAMAARDIEQVPPDFTTEQLQPKAIEGGEPVQ